MLLSNVTLIDDGKNHVLGLDKSTKGALLFSVIGMANFFKKNSNFDFVSNIMANVSSIKEGRQFMLDEKVMGILVESLLNNEVNGHRRMHYIDCIHNFCFEYDTRAEEFLKAGVVENLVKLLVIESKVVVNETMGLPAYLVGLGIETPSDQDQKKFNLLKLIMCFLLFSNCEKFLLPKLIEEKIHHVIKIIPKPNQDITIQATALEGSLVSYADGAPDSNLEVEK